MIIHTSATWADVTEAARRADVRFTRFIEGKSRSRRRRFDVLLTGSSNRRQNRGADKAALWDEWGIFLAHLFEVDPDLKTSYYSDAGDFHYKTNYRFDGGRPVKHDHRFAFSGTPFSQSCRCGAVRRWSP